MQSPHRRGASSRVAQYGRHKHRIMVAVDDLAKKGRGANQSA